MDRNRSSFRRNVPIFTGSRIVRRASAIDVRLTASDKIHNLIMQNAMDEYIKIRGIKIPKKEEQKPLDMLTPSVTAHKVQDLIQKQQTVPDRLPKLGIPELDIEISHVPKESKEFPSSEIMTFTYAPSPSSSSSSEHVEEAPVDARVPSDKILKKPSTVTTTTITTTTTTTPTTTPFVQQKHAPGPVKQARKPVQKIYRKGKVAPRYVEATHKPVPTPTPVDKKESHNLKSTSSMKTKERGASRDAELLPAVDKSIRPASLTHLYEADNISIPSWVNTIWIEDVEKQLSKSSQISLDASPSVLQQRLLDITRHLRSRNEEEYHPYSKRTQGGISNWGAIALILKALLGSGVLRMPTVFGYLGNYTAVLPTVVLLVWISITFHLYIRARQGLCKDLRKPFLSFSETMKESFVIGPKIFQRLGKYCEPFFDFMIIFHQIVATMKYGIFICAYAILMFDSPTHGVTAPFFAIPVMWAVIAIHYIKSMSDFVCIAVIGNIASCVYYGIILFQLTGKYHQASSQYITGPEHRYSYFYFVGHLFAVTDCIVTGLIVEAKMNHPRQIVGYSGIMNICLMFSALWYIIIGFFGATQFGSTGIDYLRKLDLPEYAYHCLFVAYMFALIISCCIESFYPLHILWGACLRTSIKKDKHRRAWQYFLRTAYAILPFLAIHLPTFIVYFLMFFGYIAGPFLMLVCPVIAHFCMFYSKKGSGSCRLIVFTDLCLLIFGVLAMTSSIIWYVNKFEFKIWK